MKAPQLPLCSVLSVVPLFSALAAFGHAQDQTWIGQLGTNSADVGSAAAPDGTGGLYVSGFTQGSLGGMAAGGIDAWLARYDSVGNQVWIRQFGRGGWDRANAAAPDGAGGVFVSGTTQGSPGAPNSDADVWVARYDSAGNQTWWRQLGSNGYDTASAAAPDGAGGVFVTGTTNDSLGGASAGGYDGWLARYDLAGNLLWIRQFGSNLNDGVSSAASDGSGGAYLSGTSEGSLGGPNAGDPDAWLARYDSAGSQLWITQLGTSRHDLASNVSTDGAGGVYVSGSTNGALAAPNAGSFDIWLARYDGAGSQTWIRQFGSSGQEHAGGTAPDGAGGVFVGGNTGGSLGGSNVGNTYDIWLARYDAVGNQTWITQFGSSGEEGVGRATPDGAGGVYLTGSTSGDLGGQNAGDEDAWFARYDGDLTASRYCTPGIPNSTGQSGRLAASGSNSVQANDLLLIASQLPQSSFGYFLTSRTQGLVIGAGGSQGTLCLGGAIGRYVGPGQIMSSGATGSFSLAIDLPTMPQPAGSVAAQPGETWNFQAWHRDANPMSTSNFTDAVSVRFR